MSSPSPSDPYLGALFGLACGDALGAPVAFLSQAEVEARHGRLTEMVGGGRHQWAPGEWTDDTGMALAVAERILAKPEDPVAKVGKGFLSWVATAKDVGGTISAALQNAKEQEGRRRGRPLQQKYQDPTRDPTQPAIQSQPPQGTASFKVTSDVHLA